MRKGFPLFLRKVKKFGKINQKGNSIGKNKRVQFFRQHRF